MSNTSENRIFAGITADGRLEIGDAEPIEASGHLSTFVESWGGSRSASITFIDYQIDAGEGDDASNSEVKDAETKDTEAAVREILWHIDRLIAERTAMLMSVVEVTADKKYVVFEPCDKRLRHSAIVYRIKMGQLKTVTRSHYVLPGKIFEVCVTACQLPYVEVMCVREVDNDPVQSQLTSRQEIIEELLAQPPLTFIQVIKGKEFTYTTKDGRQVSSYSVSTSTYSDISMVSVGNITDLFADGSAVFKIVCSDQNKLFLNSSFGMVKGLPFAPANAKDFVDFKGRLPEVVGIVHRIYDVGTNLLELIFDEGGTPWRSGAFIKDGRGSFMMSMPVIEAARKYICVGYPCRVMLCVNRLDHTKSFVRLPGLSAMLEGRVASTIATNRLQAGIPLPAQHQMSPARRVGNEIMMVSADFTAFMPIDKAPLPLVKMAEAGIFTPQVSIQCQLELVSDAPRHFKVVCEPVVRNCYRRYPIGTQPESVEICCSADNRIILMSDGCLAMTDRLDHGTLIGLLKGHTKAKWHVDKPVENSWLHLACGSIAIDTADVMSAGLTLGSLFEMDANGTYRGRKVTIVPENKNYADGTLMMILGNDEKTGNIVATGEFSLFTDSPEIGIQQMRVLPDLLTYGIVVAECDNGRLTAYNMNSRLERVIFQRLSAIYGDKVTALMRRDKGFKLIRSKWTGVACEHDYSAIISEISADTASLWEGLNGDTPVLFGDITLTKDDIPELPETAESVSDFQSENDGEIAMGTVSVADAVGDTVTFWLGGTRFAQNLGREALRLPIPATRRQRMAQFPIDEVFARSHRWRMDFSDPDNPRVHAHADEVPRIYTIVSRINDDEWVVQSEDGSIAITDSLSDVVPGSRVLMRLANVLGNVVYVDEAEDNFVGRKVRLQIVEFDNDVALCRDLSGMIRRRIELPLNRVSWNPEWNASQLPLGTVLKACIVEVESDRIVVDRRILLQQDALCQGLAPKPGNIYQMEVARVTDTGYLLKQNDVELMLPFNKAAAFEINVFNERYLQPGDLVAVQVEADGTTANWKITMSAAIDELRQSADEMLLFSVHHHCPDGIFVSRKGVTMFLPNRQLGHWAGRSIANDFPVGDTLEILVREADGGMLEAVCRNPAPLRPVAPQCGTVVTAVVSCEYHGVGAYADCDNGVPVYIEIDSFDDAGVTMCAGTRIAVEITAVDTDLGIVTGRLVPSAIGSRAAKSETDKSVEVLPAVCCDSLADAEPVAEPSLHIFDRIIIEPQTAFDWVVMADSHGNEAIFKPTENMPVDKLKKYLDHKASVFVVGKTLPGGRVEVTYDPLIAPRQQLLAQLHQQTVMIVDATVIGHTSNGAVVMRYGMNVLIVSPKESKVKSKSQFTQQQWAEYYAIGSSHRVLVYNVTGFMAFSASDSRL